MTDHLIDGRVLFPGVGSVEIAVSGSFGCCETAVIEALRFTRPCELSLSTELQFTLMSDGSFEVVSCTEDASFVTPHALGRLVGATLNQAAPTRVPR